MHHVGWSLALALSVTVVWVQAVTPRSRLHRGRTAGGHRLRHRRRAVADRMRAGLGQQIVSRTSQARAARWRASIREGARRWLHAGGVSNATLTILPNLDSKIQLDPLKELARSVSSRHPECPLRSSAVAREHGCRIRRAREEAAGKMTYASGGNGSVQHWRWKDSRQRRDEPPARSYKGSAQATLAWWAGASTRVFSGSSPCCRTCNRGSSARSRGVGARRFGIYPELPTIQRVASRVSRTSRGPRSTRRRRLRSTWSPASTRKSARRRASRTSSSAGRAKDSKHAIQSGRNRDGAAHGKRRAREGDQGSG